MADTSATPSGSPGPSRHTGGANGKKPAPKKPAPKKPAATKPGAKKAAATKPGAEHPATGTTGPEQAGPKPSAAKPSAAKRSAAPAASSSRRWALCASVTQELLNELVLFAMGDGVTLDPLEQLVTLPALGEVRLRLGLTITGGRFDLRGDDDGRARVVITADGDVSVHSTDYEGDSMDIAPMGFPVPPAPIPVRVEALVDPYLELRDDHTLSVGLDLERAELVSLAVDVDAPVPDGVDRTVWTGVTQMTNLMFGSMGDGLFASLGEHVGSVGMDLGPDIGMVLADLGVDHGRADARVASGLLSFGLRAHDAVEGRAEPVPVAGKTLGVSLARSGVDHLTQKLLERALGGLPMPFELEVDLGEQQVGGTLRQTRLLSERFPDLRTAVRTEVRPRLLRGRLELTVQAAWVEMPSIVPSFVNDISRRVGGLLSLAPLRFRFPATVQVPIIPGSDDTLPVRVDDLRVTADGAGIVLTLD